MPLTHAQVLAYERNKYKSFDSKQCQWRLYGRKENCSFAIIVEGGKYCPTHYKAVKKGKQITIICEKCGVGTFYSSTYCGKCLREKADNEEWLIQF